MKNDYEIRGDVTAILWTNTKGKKFEILIDTDDLERVKAFPNTWYAHWNHRPKQYYAEGKRWDGRKRVCYSMHRWIMQPEGDDEVDHIYHDGLDNRRSNLRVIPKGANQQNYKSARVHSGTGIRGVYRTESKRWLARFRVNNKHYHVGVFDTPEEAEIAIMAARAKYMPYSQEALNKDSIPDLNDIITPCFEDGLYATNTSGYRGLVYNHRLGKWFGRTRRNGVNIVGKYFKKKKDAYFDLCEKLKSWEAQENEDSNFNQLTLSRNK